MTKKILAGVLVILALGFTLGHADDAARWMRFRSLHALDLSLTGQNHQLKLYYFEGKAYIKGWVEDGEGTRLEIFPSELQMVPIAPPAAGAGRAAARR